MAVAPGEVGAAGAGDSPPDGAFGRPNVGRLVAPESSSTSSSPVPTGTSGVDCGGLRGHCSLTSGCRVPG